MVVSGASVLEPSGTVTEVPGSPFNSYYNIIIERQVREPKNTKENQSQNYIGCIHSSTMQAQNPLVANRYKLNKQPTKQISMAIFQPVKKSNPQKS